jgi:hypothetical protein
MNIDSQVTSYELSKRLKELGVKQDSYFVWFKLKEESDWSISEDWQIDDEERFDTVSAYTCSELGEMLRKFDIENDQNLTIDYYNTYNFYNIALKPTKVIDFETVYVQEKTEVDARAKMLIYLLENGLMKNEQI